MYLLTRVRDPGYDCGVHVDLLGIFDEEHIEEAKKRAIKHYGGSEHIEVEKMIINNYLGR